jgi:heme/copper-type cytochrome/quinol oxidase subunit 2
MISNNFKALFIHIFVSAISFYMYFTFNIKTGIAEYATPEAYQNHVNFMMTISVAIIVMAIILYYIGGRLLLKNQGKITRNLLSVSSVAVIGVVWWIVIYPISNLDAFSHSNIWETFAIYVSYMLSLVDNLNKDMPSLLLVSTIVPSIIMTAGIKKV